MLTQERLKELLHYDPETGLFTWKASKGRVRAGSVAGSVTQQGYVTIRIDGATHRAHRLAFLYVNGSFPPAQVDHIDHCRSNNKWLNLRPATASENQKNRSINKSNTNGYKGISWHIRNRAWGAYARLNGRLHSLGYYPTAEEASAAYEAFAKEHHGEFYHQQPQQGDDLNG